jgi:hypothetical protein
MSPDHLSLPVTGGIARVREVARWPASTVFTLCGVVTENRDPSGLAPVVCPSVGQGTSRCAGEGRPPSTSGITRHAKMVHHAEGMRDPSAHRGTGRSSGTPSNWYQGAIGVIRAPRTHG